jgi:hypothetical protein
LLLQQVTANSPRTRFLATAGCVLRDFESELLARHGHAGLRVVFEERASTLVAMGQVVAPSMVTSLRRRLQVALPRGVRLDLAGVGVERSHQYRGLTQATALYAGCAGSHQQELASELLLDDGPVEVLRQVSGASLVRGVDATLGWVRAPLGKPTRRRVLCPARGDMVKLGEWLLTKLGAPYRLGGTSERGFDCSGLVQRAFLSALGAVVPRHSRDQLSFGVERPRRLAAVDWFDSGASGTLVFVRDRLEGPCHVGVLVHDGGRPLVVHASTSRMLVVADSPSRFLQNAVRAASLSAPSLLRRYDSFVGADSIALSPRGSEL